MRISDWSSDVCSSDLSISFRNRLPISSAVSVGLSVGVAGTVMAAGSCAGVGEAGGFEWAQPERNTADETRSSVAVRRRGFALRHELIVAFLRMGLRGSLSNRTEEHKSEIQSLIGHSYSGFWLQKKK